ncbi:hypothetical protein O159_12140 [Leifsonia xyli subsp. cynodontis DSM 46306]|uniref:Phage-related protein n=1 Tax=Leifsonia xyli subsp. cynodontis DSM 46306 TaxID=1389489 RepID=U3P4P4_LEIXC|nr:hypothetical protein [Leifsonia xyli]AGW41295.1 hypothetical protein O159_12140 [Leifsonia xyli subsp. cynodontis DSM 46306]
MSTNVLEFLIVGKEQVSEAMEKVESKLEGVHGKLDKLKVAGGLALAGAAMAATDFASKSVEAYEEAQKSQPELQEAYKKFPAIADVSIEKLQELNDTIQEKTGYDHNELATAQSKLAMYGVTGKQLEELTPLVADYASKTGTDTVSAAESLGKALLGKGRALAQVGIAFKDTGTKAGNYAEVVEGLKGKVEGAAETMGGTAAGKAKILAAGFKDIQEKVGQGLMPALEHVTDAGVKVVNWLNKTPGAMNAVLIAIGLITAAVVVYTIAQVAANTAIWASPVTWIIAGIVALIAVVVLLATHWSQVTGFISTVWNGFIGWITGSISGFGKWIGDVWSGIWNGALGIVKNVWNGIADWIAGGINNVIHLINGITGAVNSVGGAVGIHIGKIPDVHLPHLATGGYVQQGGLAVVGEQGPELMYVPTAAQVFPNGTQPSAGGMHIGTFIAQANQSPAEIANELGWMLRWAT